MTMTITIILDITIAITIAINLALILTVVLTPALTLTLMRLPDTMWRSNSASLPAWGGVCVRVMLLFRKNGVGVGSKLVVWLQTTSRLWCMQVMRRSNYRASFL